MTRNNGQSLPRGEKARARNHTKRQNRLDGKKGAKIWLRTRHRVRKRMLR